MTGIVDKVVMALISLALAAGQHRQDAAAALPALG